MQKKKKIRPIWYSKEGLGGAAVNNYRLATNTVSLAYFSDKIGHMINGGCLVCGSLFAMQRTPVQYVPVICLPAQSYSSGHRYRRKMDRVI